MYLFTWLWIVTIPKTPFSTLTRIRLGYFALNVTFFVVQISFLKFPGGEITTSNFMVNILLGEIGVLLSPSLMVSVARGLELATASTSTISVLRVSASKFLPCVLIKSANTCMTDLICYFQISPRWLVAGEVLCYTIQPKPLFWSNDCDFISLWCISWKAFSYSFSTPRKLLLFSDLIIRILLLLPINFLKICVMEFVSILLQTSRYTVLVAIQVKMVLYLLSTAFLLWL